VAAQGARLRRVVRWWRDKRSGRGGRVADGSIGRGAEIGKAAANRRTPKLGVGFEEFAEEGGGVFAEYAIGGAKCGKEVRVDVELTDNFATDKDGDNDFGFGFEGAGEIAGIAGDVVNDDGHAATGGGAANALVERDAGVGRHAALEGAEDEDVMIGFLFEHVEANPIVFREFAVKERDDVVHQGFTGSGSDGQSVQFGNEVRRFRVSSGHDNSVEHMQGEA